MQGWGTGAGGSQDVVTLVSVQWDRRLATWGWGRAATGLPVGWDRGG